MAPSCRKEHSQGRALHQSWVIFHSDVKKGQPTTVSRTEALESHTQTIVLQKKSQDHEHPESHCVHPGWMLEYPDSS